MTIRERTKALAPLLRGSLSGLLAGGVVLGIAQLLAGLVGPQSSPIVAVGGKMIELTPQPVVSFAIRVFGVYDKIVLLGSLALGVAVLSAAIGIAAARKPFVGVAGMLIFGLAAGSAAAFSPSGAALDAVPAIVGAIAGAGGLLFLIGRLPVSESAGRPAEQGVDSGRRRFVGGAALAVGAAALSGSIGWALLRGKTQASLASRANLQIPKAVSPAKALPAGVDLKLKGLTPFMTTNRDFYRVDTNLVVPRLNVDDWRLKVGGMVENQLNLSFEELVSRPMIERDITLSCVSNEVGGRYAGTARWVGVPLKDLLDEAGVRSGSDLVISKASDGFTISTPVATIVDGRDAMLAVSMNGEPLPAEHGFPVRMIVPGLYGYVSATKWLVDLQLSTFAAANTYWTARGWAPKAPIKTFSRIDTPAPLSRPQPGKVAVAGVAWAQHRGIQKVEVRVDGGPWQTARLAAEASIDTWRQWVWEWDATPGRHELQVRSTDGEGKTQPEERVKPFPDGATGWHAIVVTVMDA